ncbi:hypothetical protein LY78DRAFT_20823 [Colletotrichum sublineola]|nr:hypothetical protein LY78DRAFT_20823 [Colletotrichum sublineola]
MKISILTAILYSVVSVNASCWCFESRRYNSQITAKACNSMGQRLLKVEGKQVCSISNPNHDRWITACKHYGGDAGYCT